MVVDVSPVLVLILPALSVMYRHVWAAWRDMRWSMGLVWELLKVLMEWLTLTEKYMTAWQDASNAQMGKVARDAETATG